MDAKIYVFGCFGNGGHTLQTRTRDVPYEIVLACDRLPEPLPGMKREEPEGAIIRMEPMAGWSYVTWWDRQGDERGGSHTGLLVRGTWSVEEVLAAGRAHVPWAFRVRVQG